jgi:methionyl aminopeptidase
MAKKSTKKAETTPEAPPQEEKKAELIVKTEVIPQEASPTAPATAPAEKTPEQLAKEEQEKAEKEKERQSRLDAFRKAGGIYKQVVEFIKPKIVVGAKILDLCEETEAKIKELGGEIGFPVNISINDVAAHYSAPKEDEKVIADGDVVKFDLGVAIDGYTVDGAFTISFNKEEITKNLVLAVDTAVLKGLSIIKPGVKTNEVGAATYKIIKGFGYNVIKELNGHSIEQWEIHGHKEIPNVPMPAGEKFEEDEVFALECFASTGTGKIHATQYVYIYSVDASTARVPLRNKVARKIYNWAVDHRKTLPFSQREIIKEFGISAMFGIKELSQAGKVVEHRVLKEEKGTYVAQSEHTFLVTKDGIERLT